MKQIKIGLPCSLYYYNEGKFLKEFFTLLGFDVIESKQTNKEIYQMGEEIAQDEMCTSLKIFLGHAYYLRDKCDFILNLHIDNYGLNNQSCTNYIATKEIIKNTIKKEIININIDEINYKSLYRETLKLFKNMDQKDIKKAYLYARLKSTKDKKEKIIENAKKLKSTNKKVLLVGHSYNIHDKYLVGDIEKYLIENNYEIIYSDYFDELKMIENSKKVSKNIYWKENKKYVGAIYEVENIVDNIIIVTTFPCNNDLLVNEMLKYKINKPMLNLVIDNLDGSAGIKTRLESFLTINE